jgi:hypothetical protein
VAFWQPFLGLSVMEATAFPSRAPRTFPPTHSYYKRTGQSLYLEHRWCC